MEQNVKKQLEDYKKLIEQKLDEYIPVEYPEKIWESMRYSVLAGGKRLRPILCLEACRVICGSYEPAIPTACAIEMLHSQSLIHDDLPAPCPQTPCTGQNRKTERQSPAERRLNAFIRTCLSLTWSR